MAAKRAGEGDFRHGSASFIYTYSRLAVGFFQFYRHKLGVGGGDVFANEVCLNGKLGVTSVHHAAKLNSRRAAYCHNGIQRGTGSPAGVDDVINKDHNFILDREGDVGIAYYGRFGIPAKVIPMEGYIKLSDGELNTFNIPDIFGNALCKRYATGLYTNKTYILNTLIFFNYLMGNADQSALHSCSIHDLSLEFKFQTNRLLQIMGNTVKLPCLLINIYNY